MAFRTPFFTSLLPALIYSFCLVSGQNYGQADTVNQDDLNAKWGTDWAFSGISTFAHFPYVRCLIDRNVEFDIAIIGVPFDTAVTYRPGARFGPRAIRAASSRQISFRAFNPRAGINPYASWAKIIDCGDIPVTPFDNALALRQMSEAFVELSKRSPARDNARSGVQYRNKPKVFSLGGDHSIALPALRTLRSVYDEPIAVVHFDAHLDTWDPSKFPSAWLEDRDANPTQQSYFNHGSMFWLAGQEGLIANGSSVHAGLRTRLCGADFSDNEDDTQQGWLRISTDDIDDIGPQGIINKIKHTVGPHRPVYLSVDIDVLDPGLASGTGTPEPGGWTTRELIRILRGLDDLNVVGADIVEVAPAYDGPGEATALSAAQIVYEIISNLVLRGIGPEDKAGSPGGYGEKEEL